MLTSIFDQATKSVTRTILYAGLFPVAAVLLLNLGVAAALLGAGAVSVVGAWLTSSATTGAAWATAGMLMLVIAAVAVAALAPVFRGMLEGSVNIPLVAQALEAGRSRAVAAADERRTTDAQARALLARRFRFRLEQQRVLTDAYKTARPAWGNSQQAAAQLGDRVTQALQQDDGEVGARAAVGLLTDHYQRYGSSGTEVTHQAILERLDALVNAETDKLARVSRLAAEWPTPDGPVTNYGRQMHFIDVYVRAVYQIESVVFWTRLQHVIPPAFAASLEDAKHSLDLLTATTILLWASGVFWLAAVPALFPSWFVLLTITGAAWVLGYVVYRAAAAAALSFAELVCSAFDLFRRDLLAALCVQPPSTLREERQLWLQLGQLMIYEQIPDELKLTPPGSFVAPRAASPTFGPGAVPATTPFIVPSATGGTTTRQAP